MLIPQLCEPAWQWMLGAIELTGEPVGKEPAQWTPPPARQLDPDKEGAATTKAVRSGQMTPDEMIREQGLDPDEHWEEYAKSFKRLDRLGITIDSDARKTSGAGQLQAPAPSKPASKPDEGDDEDGDEGDDNAGESSGDA
jgi:capsid protein